MEEREIKTVAREAYGNIAVQQGSCCGTSCGCSSTARPEEVSRALGYSDNELAGAPEGSNLGLGCGNPVAIASLEEGQTVLDLGSGAGFDCFLASRAVGQSGKVIGVDFTPQMVEKAQANANKEDYQNVEFRLGDIEELPVADNSVDVIISNCVINLAQDKGRVFSEALRVLKPGGRLAVSDTVRLKELPEGLRTSIEAYVACLQGALMKDEYLEVVKKAGFEKVEISEGAPMDLGSAPDHDRGSCGAGGLDVTQDEMREAASSIVSAQVSAVKPGPVPNAQ